MFADARAIDEAEDAEFGDARGNEPPATLRRRVDRGRRAARARVLLDEELEEEQRAHDAHLAERQAEEEWRARKLRDRKPTAPLDRPGAKEKTDNTTDPESKGMSSAKDFIRGDNAQRPRTKSRWSSAPR